MSILTRREPSAADLLAKIEASRLAAEIVERVKALH